MILRLCGRARLDGVAPIRGLSSPAVARYSPGTLESVDGSAKTPDGATGFTLRRVDEHTWLLQDLSFPPDDSRFVVACIHEPTEVDVEVIWMRATPLHTRYATPADVLEDFVRWTTMSDVSSRPIPIASIPPHARRRSSRRSKS